MCTHSRIECNSWQIMLGLNHIDRAKNSAAHEISVQVIIKQIWLVEVQVVNA